MKPDQAKPLQVAAQHAAKWCVEKLEMREGGFGKDHEHSIRSARRCTWLTRSRSVRLRGCRPRSTADRSRANQSTKLDKALPAPILASRIARRAGLALAAVATRARRRRQPKRGCARAP